MSLAIADSLPRERGLYTTRQVSKLTKLSDNQIRNIVNRGLLSPSRGGRSEYLFSFQDIAFLRGIEGLQSEHVSMRKIISALLVAKRKFDAPQAVAKTNFNRVGDRVLIKDQECLWDPITDRLELDFERAHEAEHENVVDLWMKDFRIEPSNNLWNEHELDSDDWYNLGIEWERLDLEEAELAYRKALKLNAGNTDAYVNLGRLTQQSGNLEGALLLYRKALDVEPTNELAHYNIGTIHDELNQIEDAMTHYSHALGLADANYNLSQLHADLGDEVRARRFMVAFERLRDSELD